jgi:hypothetical protein
MALDKTTILTAEERRFIRDYIPALSNRPHGADMPTFMDRLMDAIDVSVAVPQAQIDAHEDGTSNKHDASEVDVEGALVYFPAGDLQTALATADAALVASSLWHIGAIAAPAADDAAGVHAANTDDVQTWPGAFTDPTVPRNVTITFGSAWAGGDATVVGTDQDDAPVSEVITASAGALVAGIKIFKTVTAITHAAAGPGGLNHDATCGWGHKFGMVATLAAAMGVLTEDGNNDPAAWDSTYNAFTPTQLPDGSRNYAWAVPV